MHAKFTSCAKFTRHPEPATSHIPRQAKNPAVAVAAIVAAAERGGGGSGSGSGAAAVVVSIGASARSALSPEGMRQPSQRKLTQRVDAAAQPKNADALVDAAAQPRDADARRDAVGPDDRPEAVSI